MEAESVRIVGRAEVVTIIVRLKRRSAYLFVGSADLYCQPRSSTHIWPVLERLVVNMFVI